MTARQWVRNMICYGAPLDRPPAPRRNPYDPSTWGNACTQGVPYADTGAAIASGQAGGVHKISSGRKHRGSSSDDLEKREPTRGAA